MNKTTVSEEEIEEEGRIIEAAKKDSQKFQPLYKKYFSSIFRFVHRKVGDEETAADVVSQVFLKALVNLKKYQHRKVPFSAWLFKIASNEVNEFFRKNKRMKKVVIDQNALERLEEEVEEDLLADKKKQLAFAIQKLTPKEVQFLELRFFEAYSLKEVAYILNITEGNAKVKSHRLTKKIKDLMTPKR